MSHIRTQKTESVLLPIMEHFRGTPQFVDKLRDLAVQTCQRQFRESHPEFNILDATGHEGYRLFRREGDKPVPCANWEEADGVEFMVTVDFMAAESAIESEV